MNISEAIARRIEFYCLQKKISPNRLATESGITQSTINSILKGESKNPKVSTIKKICKGFNVSLSEFLDDPIINDSDEEE